MDAIFGWEPVVLLGRILAVFILMGANLAVGQWLIGFVIRAWKQRGQIPAGTFPLIRRVKVLDQEIEFERERLDAETLERITRIERLLTKSFGSKWQDQ